MTCLEGSEAKNQQHGSLLFLQCYSGHFLQFIQKLCYVWKSNFLRMSVNWTRNFALIMILQGVGILNCEWKWWWLISKTRNQQILKKESLFIHYAHSLPVWTRVDKKFILHLKILEKNHEIIFITLELNLEIVTICKSLIFIFSNKK